MTESKPRVVLQSGSVEVDADPMVLARLFHDLAVNKDFRAVFEENPAEFLEECGIKLSDAVKEKINPEIIAEAVAHAGGGRELAAIVAPGVAPAIRVGTRPGTRPGVQAGVRVATGSSVFAVRPRELEDLSFTDALKMQDY